MRNRNLLFVSLLILAVAFAAGCAKRQMTKSEMDRADTIAAKIAKAESMDAKDCAPRELATAHAELDHARHEATERHYNDAEIEEYFVAADKSADALLAKTIPCWEAKQAKMAAVPLVAVPAVTFTASPDTIEKGKCATLAWSTTDATGASIDQGIGSVGTSGDRQVCPPDTITYTITATGEAGTKTASVTVNVMQPAAALMFENIHFDFDKSFIRNDAKPILEKVAAYLKKTPEAKLQIEGHCDERGTSEYNLALGQRRADAAKKYLANLGVDGGRLSTISFGEEKPADPGQNESAWARNRRAVFVLR
jgi:peptidoglycan-associated lipoprotein